MKSENIHSYSATLESAMRSNLEKVGEGDQDRTTRLSAAVCVISESLLQLRKFVIHYEFQNAHEEIGFFKEIKPRFVSEHHYYSKLAEFKSKEPVLKSQKIEYYAEALQSLRCHINEHRKFNYYCLSGATNMDDKYFVRGNLPSNEISSDRDFSTGYDDQLGRLRGYRLLCEYIQKELLQLSGEQSNVSALTWTGSKTDLIELVYGLESMGAFNKGKADIKDIANVFESAFNITLGNFYRQFLDIKLRKKGKTLFLDEMREKLEIRISNFK